MNCKCPLEIISRNSKLVICKPQIKIAFCDFYYVCHTLEQSSCPHLESLIFPRLSLEMASITWTSFCLDAVAILL